jgi:hypothetical protein
MTEEQWLTGDLKKMLKYLHRRGSERKRRLFAVACCRRVWPLLHGPQCHNALETAERYADGLVPKRELSTAESDAHEAYPLCRDAGDEPNATAADAVYAATCADVGWDIAEAASSGATAAVASAAPRGRAKDVKAAEGAAQLALLRETFGNPFRPIEFAPAWRTSDVKLLAEGIYKDKAFDRMPILADALQDAGCDIDELLNHLRDTTATHVRGCWALDLVLGKE